MVDEKKEQSDLSDQEFEKISRNFLHDITSIIEEAWNISQDEKEQLENVVELFKPEGVSSSAAKKMNNFVVEARKNDQIFRALFLYMYATYEIYVDKLLLISVKNIKDIQDRYKQKYIAHESKHKGSASLMTSEDIRSLPIENLIELDKRRTLWEQEGNFHNLQVFFKIDDALFFKSKNLKFHFVEIRTRRHLLTHRGYVYDQKYLEEINQVKASPNINDPQESIRTFFEKQWYPAEKKSIDRTMPDLTSIIEKKVNIRIGYLFHTFMILIRMFGMAHKSATKKDGFIIDATHSLLKDVGPRDSGARVRVLFECYKLAHLFTSQKGETHPAVWANQLLAFHELMLAPPKKVKFDRALLMSSSESTIKIGRSVIETTSLKDPLFKVLLAVLDNEDLRAIQLLNDMNTTQNLNKLIDMYLLEGLKKRKPIEFKKWLQSAKKSQTRKTVSK